jgi:YspA, cpYpsA-related SLOG family
MTTLLVCGSRDFNNPAWLGITLDELHAGYRFTLLLEGGATGADRQAREWAIARGIPFRTFDADWMAHGKAAGPMRNRRMLEEGKHNVVVAFPGGAGTRNMVKQARAARVTVCVFEESASSVALRRRSVSHA